MTRTGLDAARVWRVRKKHQCIDAVIRAIDDPESPVGPSFEVRLFYDGALVFARRCHTRDRALEEADVKLRELLHAGWTSHW